MIPTPYSELNQVLQKLLNSIQAILSDSFIGFYLQGSYFPQATLVHCPRSLCAHSPILLTF